MIFTNPMELSPNAALALVLPLCAAVGLVYKTIRVRYLRQLPLAVLWLWVMVVMGLAALGVVFYLLVTYA